jgi:hypothetical protein
VPRRSQRQRRHMQRRPKSHHRHGDSFTCEATIDRVTHLFVVTFTDDAGSHEVGRPPLSTKRVRNPAHRGMC